MAFSLTQIIVPVTGVLYAMVCIEQLYKGNTGMAIAYFGYAFANIGLTMWAK